MQVFSFTWGRKEALLALDKIRLYADIYVVNLHSSKCIILFGQNNNRSTEVTSTMGLLIKDTYPASFTHVNGPLFSVALTGAVWQCLTWSHQILSWCNGWTSIGIKTDLSCQLSASEDLVYRGPFQPALIKGGNNCGSSVRSIRK